MNVNEDRDGFDDVGINAEVIDGNVAGNEVHEHSIKTDYDREPLESLRVSADDPNISNDERKMRVKKLAGAISHSLRLNGEINVRSFGNAAIAKSAKALAIAKDYLKATHKDLQLSFAPAFITTEIEIKKPDGKIEIQKLTGISFNTFTTNSSQVIDTESVKSRLMVKADPKEISAELRKNNVRKLAGAIAHSLEENKECVVRCFGSASIGKASKAIAIARGKTAEKGTDLYCWAEFIVADMNGNERTGLSFYCYTNG